jgi:phospholipid transport system substrate-binding protein
MMTVFTFARRNFLFSPLGLGALGVMALLWLGAPASAQAQPGEPTARVNTFYAALLDTMKQAKRLGPRGRYDKLLPVIMATFDVPGMVRIAAGSGWETASPAQQAGLVDSFSRMMTATYASRFDDFTGESFEVSPAVDQPPNKLVRTRLIQSNGKAVSLTYLMRKGSEGWKIADVYLDGTISELAARRAEFATIMKAGGPEALVGSLRQKADKLLAGS